MNYKVYFISAFAMVVISSALSVWIDTRYCGDTLGVTGHFVLGAISAIPISIIALWLGQEVGT